MRFSFKLCLILLFLILPAQACSLGKVPEIGESGSALFEDEFSDETSGWDIYSDEYGSTDYYNGVYRIAINIDDMFYWANPDKMFEDVIVEVQAGKSKGGDDMQYGVLCRYLDHNNWYALIITADGYAGIRKRFMGNEGGFITDIVQAPSVNVGSRSNSLRAECNGSRLSLYVNDELAVETFDSDITSGNVGLMAGTFDQPSAEAIFDNIIVRQP